MSFWLNLLTGGEFGQRCLLSRRLGRAQRLAKQTVANPVSVPDFFATICAAVGIDYRKNLYAADRPVPVTDQGRPVFELFS